LLKGPDFQFIDHAKVLFIIFLLCLAATLPAQTYCTVNATDSGLDWIEKVTISGPLASASVPSQDYERIPDPVQGEYTLYGDPIDLISGQSE
jgi:hypothetical protein